MRFGEFQLADEELPDPEELHESINDEPTVRAEKKVVADEDPTELVEKGFNPVLLETKNENKYCQFIYATNKENSVPTMEEEGVKAKLDNEVARPYVFYFSNGQFAFESVEGLVKHWVPQFIAKRAGTEILDEYKFYNFNQKVMENFYEKSDKITEFKFSGVSSDSSMQSETGEALGELAEEIGSQDFTGGDKSKDLSNLTVFNEAISATTVEKLKGEIDGGYTHELLLSGMYEVCWDDEEINNERRRAEVIYSKMLKYLKKFR